MACRMGGGEAWSGPSCGCAGFPPLGFVARLLHFLQQGLLKRRGHHHRCQNRFSRTRTRAAKEKLYCWLKPSEAGALRRGGATANTSEYRAAASPGGWPADPAPVHAPPDADGARLLLATVYGRLRDPGLTAED